METPAYEDDKMDVTEAPSPFLPGTSIQFAWDATSLSMLKRCPRLYYYQMIEGYRPKGEAPDLYFGIEYHQALYDYDKSRAAGINHDDAVHDTLRALLTRTFGWNSDNQYKNRPNLVRTVLWYLEKFRDDPAKTVILLDGNPACEVSFKFELDWGPQAKATKIEYDPDNKEEFSTEVEQPYLLCGHLDRVVEFNGDVYIMDRKTTKGTPGDYYFNQYEPENQMSLYTMASQVIYETPIRGVIIDVAQVAIDFSRFVRGFTYRTTNQLEEWTNDLEYWLNIAESFATQGYWPQNDTACDKYGGCKFRRVCSKSPQIRERFLESEFEKGEPWNPLKAR